MLKLNLNIFLNIVEIHNPKKLLYMNIYYIIYEKKILIDFNDYKHFIIILIMIKNIYDNFGM